jgi:hypothetical protein
MGRGFGMTPTSYPIHIPKYPIFSGILPYNQTLVRNNRVVISIVILDTLM